MKPNAHIIGFNNNIGVNCRCVWKINGFDFFTKYPNKETLNAFEAQIIIFGVEKFIFFGCCDDVT